MYSIGEYIIYGKNGVCKVAGIGKSPILPNDPRDFYELRPIAREASVIYTPVDNTMVANRPIISPSEANLLFNQISTADLLDVSNEKTRRDTYRAAINDLSPIGFVRIIKTVQARRLKLEALKKRLTEADLDSEKQAKISLFNELAVALNTTVSDIEQRFYALLELS